MGVVVCAVVSCFGERDRCQGKDSPGGSDWHQAVCEGSFLLELIVWTAEVCVSDSVMLVWLIQRC